MIYYQLFPIQGVCDQHQNIIDSYKTFPLSLTTWMTQTFCNIPQITQSLLSRHNGRDSVSNHQPHHCLRKRLFGCRSEKTSRLRVTGLCVGNSPGTGEFPAQMASNAFPFDDVIMISLLLNICFLSNNISFCIHVNKTLKHFSSYVPCLLRDRHVLTFKVNKVYVCLWWQFDVAWKRFPYYLLLASANRWSPVVSSHNRQTVMRSNDAFSVVSLNSS